ncbi:MAG: DUF4396 domain-containing protein, partial [Acidobacteriota bacterium]|nr:DUF4396 domain-containing protein [Acidobacteriota bacterium]
MISGSNPPQWLFWLSVVALTSACASAVLIAADILRARPQKMPVMNAVWPITGLYLGPLAVAAYWIFGRTPARDQPNGAKRHAAKPFWQVVFTGVCHCGAGCTLGDFAGEWIVFVTGFTVASSVLWANFATDFTLAYLVGIVFQYYAIAPMRNLSGWPGIQAAIKADTVSLVAFEIGMFAWMGFADSVLFSPRLDPNSAVYWFSMQIA